MKPFTLIWHPHTEDPATDDESLEFLLFNPCDGYHIAEWTGQEFVLWTQGMSFEEPNYSIWAKLPDSISEMMQAARTLGTKLG